MSPHAQAHSGTGYVTMLCMHPSLQCALQHQLPACCLGDKLQPLTCTYMHANAPSVTDDFMFVHGLHCSIGFLPASWEVGYNHFSGRLGLNMPETAAILQAYWPEWQVRQDFCVFCVVTAHPPPRSEPAALMHCGKERCKRRNMQSIAPGHCICGALCAAAASILASKLGTV
jgi:hypothetical protein